MLQSLKAFPVHGYVVELTDDIISLLEDDLTDFLLYTMDDSPVFDMDTDELREYIKSNLETGDEIPICISDKDRFERDIKVHVYCHTENILVDNDLDSLEPHKKYLVFREDLLYKKKLTTIGNVLKNMGIEPKESNWIANIPYDD